jgi:predicted alpha/beta hydrolase
MQSELKPLKRMLQASDGFTLTALEYPAQQPVKGRLIVAGATGVPQLFYKRFALFASRRGYRVLTMDYRGIGLSKHGSLKGFSMNYLDWARLDLAAALDYMAKPCASASSDKAQPLFMVGHSFGGHAFGLLPNAHQVSRFYTFGTGAGWHGWMPRLEQIKVLAMWRIVAPALVRAKGYLAWNKLGMGEDLPLGVFRQWRHWCRYPRYFFDDPAMVETTAGFGKVNTPMVAANAVDDLWAMPQSRQAFMSGYTQNTWQSVDIDPKSIGAKAIGHMGYFRANAEPLWKQVIDWFEQPEPRLASSR